MKNIEIIGGGTVFHVRNHLALCAPAYGTTARELYDLYCQVDLTSQYRASIHLTKMADNFSNLETNQDISDLVDELVANSETKIIFFNPALVDFEGAITISNSRKPTTSSRWMNASANYFSFLSEIYAWLDI